MAASLRVATFYDLPGIVEELRSDIDLEATIDLLYAPIYYRLQMGARPLSDAYIDEIFDQAMTGLLRRKD
jgi:hypothetical protein